jgi:hypothetical protein
MGHLLVIGIIILLSGIVSILWVRGIDYMHTNHPDYKGEDFLNWGEEKVEWDDNKAHTEGGI